MQLRSPGKFAPSKSIKYALIPNTAGCDIHYLIAEGEDKEALDLQGHVRTYINKNKPADVHLTQDIYLDTPKGPWPKNMWELQISPMDKKDEADPSAFDVEKNKRLHGFMKLVAEFTKQKIAELGLKGSLLIHANIWPDNSDMQFEFELHDVEKHAWLVCGPAFEFKNIWKPYIAIEKEVKMMIAAKGAEWVNSVDQRKEVVVAMQKLFCDDVEHGDVAGEKRLAEIARKTENVLKGQNNFLRLMQGRLVSQSKRI